MSSADDQYEQKNDVTGGEVPSGIAGDNDYKSRTGQSHIPVQSDDAPVEDPIDPATADSDEILGVPFSFLMFERFDANLYQRKTTLMLLMRATSSVDALEERNPVVGIGSLAMKKVCLDQRTERHQLAKYLYVIWRNEIVELLHIGRIIIVR